MKWVLGCFILLSLACQTSILSNRKNGKEAILDNAVITQDIPVEQGLGIYSNDSGQLSVYFDNRFKLVELKDVENSFIEGNLNYERGFNNDIDTTLYILDFDKPGFERYYVRVTNSNFNLLPLNRDRQKLNKPHLIKKKPD